MKNFTSKGLLVLPARACYLSLDAKSRERFNHVIGLLPRVFKSNYGIELFYFNTNVIYGLPMPDSMRPVFCLCPGDADFLNGVVKRDGFFEFICDSSGQFKRDGYEALREKVIRKYPVNRGMTQKQRIAAIESRERDLARLIAGTFSLIISFESEDRRRYDLRTKKSDGRILIEIDMRSMEAKGLYSGEASNMVTLMDREWAYKKAHRWEESS